MFLPSKMGLVQRITPEEIIVCDSKFTIDLAKPGKYFIYGGFKSTIPFRLESNNVVSVAIKSQTTEKQINVFSVGRGIRLYDSPLIKGRPFFEFEISTPDKYEVLFYRNSFSNGGGTFTIVPDYTTGNETVISLAFGIQIALLIVLVVIIYFPVYKRKRNQIKTIEANQKQRQIKGKEFWEEEIRRANNVNSEDDKKNFL